MCTLRNPSAYVAWFIKAILFKQNRANDVLYKLRKLNVLKTKVQFINIRL